MHEVVDQFLAYLKAPGATAGTPWSFRGWSLSEAGAYVYTHAGPLRSDGAGSTWTPNRYCARCSPALTVQPNVDQMVAMMSRTLISRPNLEKVIRMADLDIKLKTTEDREALILRLGRDLQIRTTGRENLYTIAYADKNPQEAKRVVQSLLTIFVEGSLGDKRKDSDSARRFLDEQLKAYSDKLVAAENCRSPSSSARTSASWPAAAAQDYYARLGEAQAAVNQAELELKEAENARDAIKKQLSRRSGSAAVASR